eukprot:scpid75983/ scgid30995/ 
MSTLQSDGPLSSPHVTPLSALPQCKTRIPSVSSGVQPYRCRKFLGFLLLLPFVIVIVSFLVTGAGEQRTLSTRDTSAKLPSSTATEQSQRRVKTRMSNRLRLMSNVGYGYNNAVRTPCCCHIGYVRCPGLSIWRRMAFPRCFPVDSTSGSTANPIPRTSVHAKRWQQPTPDRTAAVVQVLSAPCHHDRPEHVVDSV